MKREHFESSGRAGGGGFPLSKGKMIGMEEADAGMDELLAVLGYKVRSSDMADVAQKLEQLDMAMGSSSAQDDALLSQLATDTVHYNPSDLSNWLENMLSELNAPPIPLLPAPPPHPIPISSDFLAGNMSAPFHEPGDPDYYLPRRDLCGPEPQVDCGSRNRKRMKASSPSTFSSRTPAPAAGSTTPATTVGGEVSSVHPLVMLDTQEAGIRLVHALLACAEAVHEENYKAADAILKQISVLASSQGGAMRKVAGYFAEALARRIYRINPHQDASLDSAFSDILEMHFYESCPYLKFAHFTTSTPYTSSMPSSPASPTSPIHLLFGIASSVRTWPRRRDYVRAWWRPGITRGLVFLDSHLPSSPEDNQGIPPLRTSADTSRFPYSFKGGLRSSIRVARIAKELVDAFDGKFLYGDVRWIVLGDDDTVFFVENLAATLAKYDWEQWYYVGSFSESAEQNAKNFFDMAFGGGGFAISYPLAKVLSKVMDSCLMRYGHLFGSDARVFACLAELGVGLTREPGFHQIDLRGSLFGLLSTHPLSPLVSLHHLDSVDPLFPGKNHSQALKLLLKAVSIDPERILQQTVCYDRKSIRTVSVSWGFTVQIFEGNQPLTDLLASQKTFRPWKRGRNATSNTYLFNTKEFPRDPCKRPAIFFLESLSSSLIRIETNYSRDTSGNCIGSPASTKRLQQITVFSEKYNLQFEKALRRHCCDVLDSSHDTAMNISIRRCGDDELIAMRP